MIKFKVGDKISFIGCNGTLYEETIRQDGTVDGFYTNFTDEEQVRQFMQEGRRELKLVVGNKNIMSTIKDFVKNAVLSVEERLLRKHGFKNDRGEYTQEAIDFVIQRVCEDFEDDMVEVAQGLEEEVKTCK